MNSEEAGKYIKDVNESYLKILSEDVEAEKKNKKRLTGMEPDKVEEAYRKMLSDARLGGYSWETDKDDDDKKKKKKGKNKTGRPVKEALTESKVKMTTVYLNKATKKSRNELMKWAKEKGASALFADPFHTKSAVSVDANYAEAMAKDFPDIVKNMGGSVEYTKKKSALKPMGGGSGKITKELGYTPDYMEMYKG